MKLLMHLFFLNFILSCSQKTFKQISISVDSSRNYSNYKMYYPFFHPYRMELKKRGELDFINFQQDTFYIQEVFYTEASPMMIGSIWNAKGMTTYSYIGKKREQPGIQLVDSSLINFLNKKNASILEYYQNLPQRSVKNQYYFEKIEINNNGFKILERANFSY